MLFLRRGAPERLKISGQKRLGGLVLHNLSGEKRLTVWYSFVLGVSQNGEIPDMVDAKKISGVDFIFELT